MIIYEDFSSSGEFICHCFFIVGSNFSQESTAQFQNLEGIELNVKDWKKIESGQSDVLVMTVVFTNNGELSSDIFTEYMFLIDSQKRTFSPASYFELKGKGISVTSKECPFVFTASVNPGLSTEAQLCYEIPKGTNSNISLALYNVSPEFCDEPFIDCTIKSFPFTLKNQSEPDDSKSKIPSWVRNTMQWYLDGKISEDKMISAIQYLVNEGIIKLK